MESFTDLDRKRKAEDDINEEIVPKKILLEENEADKTETEKILDESVKAEVETEQKPNQLGKCSEESAKETVEKAVPKLDERPSVKVESESSLGVKRQDSPPPADTLVPFDRLIVLHVEATCDENMTNPAAVQVTKESSEIIELSFVVLDAHTLKVLHKKQIFVKPERTVLTSFCTDVTGIQWSSLENANTLKSAINELDSYIQTNIEEQQKSFCFVTHGGWILRIQLPRESRDKNIELPSYLAYCRMFDLKQEIQRWQVHHPEVSFRSTSLRDLCELFKVKRVRDHSVGLNACLTTINIIRYLTSFRHPDVFVHPIDTNADLRQFKKEESLVVHLAGLPFEVTQGELEAWFSSNGLRPTTMWMIQPGDHSKPSISGFVLFQTHSDSMRALALNGRCLGDRPIEVCPSSSRVVEAAGNMLVSFPLQAKSRQLRPGDWNCSSCGFHNFASRQFCFKCNCENPSPSPHVGTYVPHSAPFAAGDWICPNQTCSFHNYASRMQCKRCGSYKPGGNKIVNTSAPRNGGGQYGSHYGTPNSAPPNGPSYGGGYTNNQRPHHHITFRPGDWYCPNPACGFQNFASRQTCFRCYTHNPNQQQQQQQSPQQYWR
ncbi:ribonuclease H-like domain-containing protein [Sporodiniella umbellata]|nr:ribonuclease H-like domain-containing protein [Sporodiniella umbellata]